MFEKSWLAVAPQLFTTDGSSSGIISIPNTAGFKVKAQLVLSASTLPNLTVQLKRVLSSTQMLVGPIGQNINATIDISAYTVALGAFVLQNQQARVTIAPADIVQAVYEQEPTVAIRVLDVDEFGNPYNADNPMPIAFDGTVTVGDISIVDQTTHDPLKVNVDGSINVKLEPGSVVIGEVEVIGSNGNILQPNADGSINVNIQPATSGTNTVVNTFGTAAAVVSGATTTIVQYTVPLGKTALLERSVCSGENIGTYTFLINGVTQSVLRTYYAGSFNVTFEFTTGQDNGLVLHPGDIVKVTILHNRPYTGNFDGRIQVFEITP